MRDIQEKLKQRGLNSTWDGNTLKIQPNKTVLCDYCDENYTDSDAQGGILFGSYATCPKCTPKVLKDAKNYDEEYYIKAECPAGMSFRDWVYTLRC